MTGCLADHKVVSSNEWLKARRMLLKKEIEFIMLHEQLCQEQHKLPWVAVHNEYACSAIRRCKG
jgi:predicted dithiol-disulfide oxidoreductase (DUF899 family)